MAYKWTGTINFGYTTPRNVAGTLAEVTDRGFTIEKYEVTMPRGLVVTATCTTDSVPGATLKGYVVTTLSCVPDSKIDDFEYGPTLDKFLDLVLDLVPNEGLVYRTIRFWAYELKTSPRRADTWDELYHKVLMEETHTQYRTSLFEDTVCTLIDGRELDNEVLEWLRDLEAAR